MRRSFEIIRKPDAEPSFLFNNVEVRYVGTCPETGISFYCSIRTNYGVRLYPDGRKALENTHEVHFTKNDKRNLCRKQRYMRFAHAFGQGKQILISHAVWMAAGRSIPEGMQIDHINGCAQDNSLSNLRVVSRAVNCRDGGFCRKLRNKGINPVAIDRTHLLRYYARMAKIKEAISRWRYQCLTFDQLRSILYLPPRDLSDCIQSFYNIHLEFQL
ncbi:MAG: HNH endonuclease [Paludibacteraceae bacterium]|nr:HNH endonuclease [Paludibacteraceae bacterium]